MTKNHETTAELRYSAFPCRICGGGLCMMRVCAGRDAIPQHGLIMCDECEAIWMSPDPESPHVYPDAESAACPICQNPLFGDEVRFASQSDLEQLGWAGAIDPALTMEVER